MADDPHATGGPPTYLQPGARTPTHAERVRTLLAAHTDGTLSTLAVDPAGHPFGSIVAFAVTEDGTPLLSLSTMAEHTRNLDADPRASLLVTAASAGIGRLAAERATLLGTVTPVDDGGRSAAAERYLAAHPDAFWVRFPDFGMYRLAVEHVRYVRGFGEMSWVNGDGYRDATPDPLAGAEAGIVAHMNDDHGDALRAMVDAFLDVPGEVVEATMLSCDRYGFDVRLALADGAADRPGVAFGRIGFDRPLTAPDQARAAMIALVRTARGGIARS